MPKRPLLTRESKEKKVIELYEKGLNVRQISKRVHMNFSDIGKITRKYSGEDEVSHSTKKLSKHSMALELFRTGHSNLEVAIKLGLTDSETEGEQEQYRRLINMDKYCEFYDAMKGNLEYYLQLYTELSIANLTVHQAIEGIRYAQLIASMKLEYTNLQNSTRQLRLESFEVWKGLQLLKQEEQSISNQLEPPKEVYNPIGNETHLPEPNNTSLTKAKRRSRRRGTHNLPTDFKTYRPDS